MFHGGYPEGRNQLLAPEDAAVEDAEEDRRGPGHLHDGRQGPPHPAPSLHQPRAEDQGEAVPHVPEHEPEEQAEADRDDERRVQLAVGGQAVEPHDLLEPARHRGIAQQGGNLASLRLEGGPVLHEDDGMGRLPARQSAQLPAGLLGHPPRDDHHVVELAPHPAERVNALHGIDHAVKPLQLDTVLPGIEDRHVPAPPDLRLQKIEAGGQLRPAAGRELLDRRLEHAHVHPSQKLLQRRSIGGLAERGHRRPPLLLEERKEQGGPCGGYLPQPLPVLPGKAPQDHPAAGG